MPAGTTAEHQGIFRRGTHNCCADAYVCRKCRSEPQSSTANCFRDTRRTIRVVTRFDPPSSAVPQRSRSPPRRTVSGESPVAACVNQLRPVEVLDNRMRPGTWVEVRRNGARSVEVQYIVERTDPYRARHSIPSLDQAAALGRAFMRPHQAVKFLHSGSSDWAMPAKKSTKANRKMSTMVSSSPVMKRLEPISPSNHLSLSRAMASVLRGFLGERCPSVADYVRGPKATRGASVVGGG